MREVLFDELVEARWEITEVDCDSDRTSVFGTTVLATDTTNARGGEYVHFVFSLEWTAERTHNNVGDPEWDFSLGKVTPLEPEDDIRLLGEDEDEDLTWKEVFADKLLFQDIIMAEVWEAYTKEEFIRECTY